MRIYLIIKYLLKAFILFLSLIILVKPLFSQTPIPKDYLTAKDKEQLEEITSLMQDAESLQEEAQSISEDLEKISSESNKRDNLRKKALKKDVKAFEKIKEANVLKYKIYERHLEKFEKDSNSTNTKVIKARLLQEDAREYFYRGSALRSEAYNQTKTLEDRFEKLEKATSIEKLGFEKLENALALYYERKKLAKQINQKQTGSNFSGTDQVVINKELLINIKQTLARIPERDLFEEFTELKTRDTVSGDKLVDLWYSYIYGEPGVKSSGYDQQAKEESLPALAEATGDKKNEKPPKKKNIEQSSQPASEKTDKNKKENKLYRVQIATDKQPLSQATLKRIYDGKMDIERIVESGWYKYSIGDFNSFEEAEKFRERLNNEDAFIVAKEPETKTLSSNELKKEEEPPDVKEGVDKMAENKKTGVSFKVQIAASHQPLSSQEIKDIYSGELKVEQKKVNEWYKYSLGDYDSYEQAEKLRKKVPVNGAFVTAYKNGELMNLSEILDYKSKPKITESKPSPSALSSDIVFKVQIAADRIVLNDNKLKSIYSGVKEIEMNKGNGWYRYSVGNCPTYYHAERLKKYVNVRGAFVVAYKEGKRLNAYKFRNKAGQCTDIQSVNNPPRGEDIVFAVQIAASINQLNKNDLRAIYCGNRTINEFREDQWYKYSVGSFPEYDDAYELKRTICVPGAFIVAFKNDMKISVKNAIKESSNR
jgi:hypothetical protein